MELTIMRIDKTVEKIPVKRVFIQNTTNGQFLYYELYADTHGHGKTIAISDLRCWEVNAVIQGGSAGLVL